MQQVEKAVAIFESKMNGTATALFMFDIAPSHQRHAPDALSAQHMVKGPHPTWTHHKGAPKMCPGHFVDGSPQDLYFHLNHPTMPGWFKGMQRIIEEHGLWPEHGLPSQCLGSSVRPGTRTVALARFFLPSLTLDRSVCTSKNLSHPEVTFATFTQSSIVN